MRVSTTTSDWMPRLEHFRKFPVPEPTSACPGDVWFGRDGTSTTKLSGSTTVTKEARRIAGLFFVGVGALFRCRLIHGGVLSSSRFPTKFFRQELNLPLILVFLGEAVRFLDEAFEFPDSNFDPNRFFPFAPTSISCLADSCFRDARLLISVGVLYLDQDFFHQRVWNSLHPARGSVFRPAWLVHWCDEDLH